MTALKQIKCQYCGKILDRRRLKRGELESPSVHNRRKYCDRICMRKAFLKMGKENGSGGWSSTHGTARNIKKLFFPDITECQICGKSSKLDIHHKDFDETNNTLENLQALCRSCHMKIHRPKTKCKIEGCEQISKSHGYCEKHYQRMTKYGNPYMVKKANGKIEIVGKDDLIKTYRKPVVQMSVDDEYIRIWESARMAQNELHIFESAINRCCRGVIKTYKGYKWRYATEEERQALVDTTRDYTPANTEG